MEEVGVVVVPDGFVAFGAAQKLEGGVEVFSVGDVLEGRETFGFGIEQLVTRKTGFLRGEGKAVESRNNALLRGHNAGGGARNLTFGSCAEVGIRGLESA